MRCFDRYGMPRSFHSLSTEAALRGLLRTVREAKIDIYNRSSNLMPRNPRVGE